MNACARPSVRLRGKTWGIAALLALLPLSGQAARLEFVMEVDGVISDVTPQRVLYRAVRDGREELVVHNRVSGSVRTIPEILFEVPTGEALTSRGVIFGVTSDIGAAVYEWTGGQPRAFEGTPRGLRVSRTSRQYAVWPTWQPEQGGRLLHLRDVLGYRDMLVGGGSVRDLADVSDDGQVVFTRGPAPDNVFRYRDGQTTQLTQARQYSHFNPMTDGVNVVYRKQVADTASQIVMYNDTLGEVVLREASESAAAPHEDYLPHNGWIAFTRVATVDGAPVRQVWLRSPSGQLSAISSGQVDAHIDALGTGQVMYVSGGYLYLGRPGTAPELVSPYSDGTRSTWLQGSWYLYFGGALYRVVL